MIQNFQGLFLCPRKIKMKVVLLEILSPLKFEARLNGFGWVWGLKEWTKAHRYHWASNWLISSSNSIPWYRHSLLQNALSPLQHNTMQLDLRSFWVYWHPFSLRDNTSNLKHMQISITYFQIRNHFFLNPKVKMVEHR